VAWNGVAKSSKEKLQKKGRFGEKKRVDPRDRTEPKGEFPSTTTGVWGLIWGGNGHLKWTCLVDNTDSPKKFQ